jgi:hypothetical protein
MKKNKSIQIKASILMIVFSLNTIVGFACSVGLDKVFVANHHKGKVIEGEVHVHPDGKKHIHQNEEAPKANVHVHADGKKHLHQEKVDKNDGDSQSKSVANKETPPNENEGNCCSGTVTKFEQLDKSITQSSKIFHPVFFIINASGFYNSFNFYSSFINTDSKYFVRSYHPPIPNIRVAIQSFQI